MRILVALTVAAVLAGDANAARPPTPRERAQIVLAVSTRITAVRQIPRPWALTK